MTLPLDPKIAVDVDASGKALRVRSISGNRESRAVQGLTWSLLRNMVAGVTKPFERQLEINGVGYNAKLEGTKLILQVGYCNPVELVIPEGVEVKTPDATHIHLKGADLQKVGQFAAEIRKVRPPEPYKGKGIRYANEVVKRKQGKAFVSGGE